MPQGSTVFCVAMVPQKLHCNVSLFYISVPPAWNNVLMPIIPMVDPQKSFLLDLKIETGQGGVLGGLESTDLITRKIGRLGCSVCWE